MQKTSLPALFLLLVSPIVLSGCCEHRSSACHAQTHGNMCKDHGKITVVAAVYGSSTNFADVSIQVQTLLEKADADFFARPQWLHADPSPGWNKTLVIVYTVNGNKHLFTAAEGGKVSARDLLTKAQVNCTDK